MLESLKKAKDGKADVLDGSVGEFLKEKEELFWICVNEVVQLISEKRKKTPED